MKHDMKFIGFKHFVLNILQFFQVLLTMIWLRAYHTMHNLGFIFGLPVSSVHRIIHKTLRILHSFLIPKYIKWHNMQQWRSLAGKFPEWPRVVAILDCTPFRISKPKGAVTSSISNRFEHNLSVVSVN